MREQLPGRCCSCSSRPRKARPRASTAAPLMLEEGVFEIAKPEAMFGLHVIASLPTRRDRLSRRAR